MPPVRWHHDALIAAPPEAVYRWMVDFREDDHDRPAFRRGAGIPQDAPSGGSRRQIVSREGSVVTIKDSWGRRGMTMKAKLDEAARTVTLDGEMGYHSVWRAAPEGNATRLSVSGEMAPNGLFGLLMPLFRGRFLKQMAQDFEGHVEDLRESVGAQSRR